MNKAIISFVTSLIVGFGLGYLVFGVIIGRFRKTTSGSSNARY